MSQLNHNAAYVYEVDGLTVWEKLRNIRNFLGDRQRALAISKLKLADQNKKMADKPEDDIDRLEFEIERPHQEDIIDDCEREIKFLIEFERRLAAEAEKTRIPGKSDKDMYEINFYDEQANRILLRAYSEMTSCQQISPSTIESLIRNPKALELAKNTNLINKDFVPHTLICKQPMLLLEDS